MRILFKSESFVWVKNIWVINYKEGGQKGQHEPNWKVLIEIIGHGECLQVLFKNQLKILNKNIQT